MKAERRRRSWSTLKVGACMMGGGGRGVTLQHRPAVIPTKIKARGFQTFSIISASCLTHFLFPVLTSAKQVCVHVSSHVHVRNVALHSLHHRLQSFQDCVSECDTPPVCETAEGCVFMSCAAVVVCVCVFDVGENAGTCMSAGTCTSAGVQVTIKRRLFAGMENAKIRRCCWTKSFSPSKGVCV